VVEISAHWAETDYGLGAGQHAVLPEGKGKGGHSISWKHRNLPEITSGDLSVLAVK